MYKKARLGELPNFTGIDSPYEKPNNPEIILKTENKNPDQLVDHALNYLKLKNILEI